MLVHYMVIRWHNMPSFSFREFKRCYISRTF